jgi:hypothetical protein
MTQVRLIVSIEVFFNVIVETSLLVGTRFLLPDKLHALNSTAFNAVPNSPAKVVKRKEN